MDCDRFPTTSFIMPVSPVIRATTFCYSTTKDIDETTEEIQMDDFFGTLIFQWQLASP